MRRSPALIQFLLAVITCLIPALAAAQPITTVAGGGVGDGGPAVNATIHNPYGIALDAAGNLFIASPESSRVRRVDAITQVITTVAGTGMYETFGDGGLAVNAGVREPVSVATDAAGNVYLVDRPAQKVRRIDAATGIITTVAGIGGFSDLPSGLGGPATDAALGWTLGIAVSPAGDIYLASSSYILKVTAATGIINAIAGTGYALGNGLNENGLATEGPVGPSWLALDASGNLYFSDNRYSRVRRITPAGIIRTIAGNGGNGSAVDDGPAVNSPTSPSGLTIDSAGNLLFFDNRNATLRKVTLSTGIITRVAGTPGVYDDSGDGGLALNAAFRAVLGISADAAGNIYLTDFYGARVRRIDAAGIISTIAGNGTRRFFGENVPATTAAMYAPTRIVFDLAGNLLVSEVGNNRVRRVNLSTGIITSFAGTDGGYLYPRFGGDGGPAVDALLYAPRGMALDAAGNVFIADANNNAVRRVDAVTGVIDTVLSNGLASNGETPNGAVDPNLSGPDGIAVDAAGNLYVPSYTHISRLDAVTGALTLVAGRETEAGHDGDGGPAVGALLQNPRAIIFDAAGNMFFTEDWYIRRIDAMTGIITTVAGNADFNAGADGSDALNTFLWDPNALAFDAAGHLYVSDTASNRIRRINAATGIVTTVAGNGSTDSYYGFSPDGTDALMAHVPFPIGLAIRGNELYYADPQSARIRKFTLPFSTSTPTLTWSAPSSIAAGTPLGGTQLNATARIPGTFTYVPAAGTQLAAGTRTLTVTFTPVDSVNFTSNTATITIEVIKANTTTAVTSSRNPSVPGQAVTFTATVSATSTPSGTVTFKDGATTIGTGTLAANGKATLSTSSLSSGGHAITAVYNGNASFNASTSAALTQTVGNTPAGANVVTTPVDTTTGSPSPITLTFGNVTVPGTTTVTSSNTGFPPPTGYAILSGGLRYYDISTTAQFSGFVTVCINFGGTGHPALFHHENGSWKDITTTYPSPGVVCGRTSSLSPFALFVSNVQQLVDLLTNAVTGSNLRPQAKAALLALVQKIPVKLAKLTPAQRAIELLKVKVTIAFLNQLLAQGDIDPTRGNQWLSLSRAIESALQGS